MDVDVGYRLIRFDLRRRRRLPEPGDVQRVADRQYDGADEQTDDAVGDHAADRAEKITSVGTLAPRPNTSGFKKLSQIIMTKVQMAKIVAGNVSAVENT